MKIGSILLINDVYILSLIVTPAFPLLLLFTVHTPLWTCLADNEDAYNHVSYRKYLIQLRNVGSVNSKS